MTCKSTATSACIWQLAPLLVLQGELARLPLRQDLLHLPVRVQLLDRDADLRSERVALPRRDALGRCLDLLAGGLELPVRRADVVQDRCRVGEVGVHLAG